MEIQEMIIRWAGMKEADQLMTGEVDADDRKGNA